MYYISQITDTLRVPPSRFDEDLKSILLELARDSLEERIFPELGFIVAVLEAEEIGKGRLIPQESGAFYPCVFKVLCYKPERNEIVQGKVVEVVDFGVFIQVSTVECLCHKSQMGDDYFVYKESDNSLVGRDTGRRVNRDDVIRGRIAVVGLQKNAVRVGITTRQAGLGKLEWIEEWKRELEEKRASEIVEEA